MEKVLALVNLKLFICLDPSFCVLIVMMVVVEILFIFGGFG